MKILGIIAEYNPFHKGHKYQIDMARKISGADYVIALISGNYVQRGGPAIFHKSIRAKMALSSGADAVFEIPSFFSSSSASDFAAYGVNLLHILGADYISFGAENNNQYMLEKSADILNEVEIEEIIKEKISAGFNYAKARHMAIKEKLQKDDKSIEDIDSILSSPNNILAIEYLKNIKLKKSNINPVIIGRSGSGYHESRMDEEGFSSATAIRKEIGKKENNILSGVPAELEDLYKNSKPIFEDDFLFMVQRNILEKIYKGEELSRYCDISKELSNTIKKNIIDLGTVNFNDFILSLKGKNYTYTRISRGIFHIVLNHLKQDLEEIKSDKNMHAYASLLGFRKSAKELLSELKKRCEYPIIAKVSSANKLLNKNALKLFQNDIYSDYLYNSIYFEKYRESLANPYRRNVVKV